jgi:hypothetical protein
MDCFHCGRKIEFIERVAFREQCRGCGRSLHVCLNCNFYDPALNNQCRETQAEHVVDKDRANFCEYFLPRQKTEPQRLSTVNDARAKLDALFKKKG